MSATDMLNLYHDSKQSEAILKFSNAGGCYMRVGTNHFCVMSQGVSKETSGHDKLMKPANRFFQNNAVKLSQK